MSDKALRGKKRTCPACEGRFYDLNRSTIPCPLCGVEFDAEEEDRRLAEALAPEVAKPAPAPKRAPVLKEETEDEETEEIEDLDSEDEDTEVADPGDDTTFLEDEEDDDNPVSNIVGGGAAVEGDDEDS